MTYTDIEQVTASVHVENWPDKEHGIYRVSTRTIVISSGVDGAGKPNTYQELLSGPDPSRCKVVIIPIDGPVVLCDSLDKAQSTDNTVTALPNARGAIIPLAFPLEIDDAQSQLWVAGPATGVNLLRVSVITTHRVRYESRVR